MQLSFTSRENQCKKNVISSIHRDNVIKELIKYQTNAIVANIDDYHNIHGLRMPTTTSTSTVAHMITILAISIPTASAILKNIVYNMDVNQYSIHNPLLVDGNSLISRIESHHMALLSQSFNDRFIGQLTFSKNDLLNKLIIHCYDADIHEKWKDRQLRDTLLIDFIKLDLHSTEAYIKAMETFASFSEFRKYL